MFSGQYSGKPNHNKGHRYDHLGGQNYGEQGIGYTDDHLTTDLIYTANNMLGTMRGDHARQAQAILANNGQADERSIRNAVQYLRNNMGNDSRALHVTELLEGSIQTHHNGTQNIRSNGETHAYNGDGMEVGGYYNKSNSFQSAGLRDPLTGKSLGWNVTEVNDGRSN